MTIRTTPTSTAYKSNSWYFGEKRTAIVQRVPIVHGSAFAAVGINVPPRARVLWHVVQSQTAVPVTGNDATSTANSFALVMHPTTATAALTQPATATLSSPTGTNAACMVAIQTDTSSTAPIVRGTPRFETSAAAVNTNTVDALLVLQPSVVSSNRLYANGTSGFVFGTSSATSTTGYTVDVHVEIAEYTDWPSLN